MSLKRIKRPHEMAVRTTISMPPVIYDAGQERARRRAFASFSDYVQALIRADSEYVLAEKRVGSQ
jgi:Arc/MetJ-type ribon-helix-helix transcriptional regulator